MFTYNLHSTFITLGPLEIRYYGIIFALGFILAYFIIRKLAYERLNLSEEKALDYIFWLAVGVVLGARVFYVLFYNPMYYLPRIWEIFYLWQGGLSFHGGLIGGITAIVLFCRRNNIDLLKMADITSIPVALGLFFGRIGNFLNAELIGRPSSLPWCVKFPGVEDCRHPSQIYASLKNLLIFSILFMLKDKKMKDGMLFTLFLFMYSILRFIVGFFRAPDPQLGFFLGLTMGQYLNILTFIFAIGLYVYINKINK